MAGQHNRRRIAMLGTRGVPAAYGGFETAVEEIGRRLADGGDQVTVYCRQRPTSGTYLGMKLVWRPSLATKSLETLSHTLACLPHLLRRQNRPHVVFLFNSGNALVVPILKVFSVRIVAHPDGLEWLRRKWPPIVRICFRIAERLTLRLADEIIADAEALKAYYAARYHRSSEYVPYGAAPPNYDLALLQELELPAPRSYHLIVSRMEPENHVLELLQGYVRSRETRPLIIVGSAAYNDEYTKTLAQEASGDPRVTFLGGVYDQNLLNYLYANAFSYWHGHSVGGTNPSLLRALAGGTPTLAHDNPFNREVAETAAMYFSTVEDVTTLLDEGRFQDHVETCDRTMIARRIRAQYDWDRVALGYSAIIDSVCQR